MKKLIVLSLICIFLFTNSKKVFADWNNPTDTDKYIAVGIGAVLGVAYLIYTNYLDAEKKNKYNNTTIKNESSQTNNQVNSDVLEKQLADKQDLVNEMTSNDADYATCIDNAKLSYNVNDYENALKWYRKANSKNSSDENAKKWIKYLETKLELPHDSNQMTPTNANNYASSITPTVIKTNVVRNNDGEGYKGIPWGSTINEVIAMSGINSELSKNVGITGIREVDIVLARLIGISSNDYNIDLFDTQSISTGTEDSGGTQEWYMFYNGKFFAYITSVLGGFNGDQDYKMILKRLKKKHGNYENMNFVFHGSSDFSYETEIWTKKNSKIILLSTFPSNYLVYLNKFVFNDMKKQVVEKISERELKEKNDENDRKNKVINSVE